MSRFAPHAHLTAIEDIWGPYYITRAQAMLDGKWEGGGDAWWGIKEGAVVMSPYNKSMPADVVAAAEQDHRRLQGRQLRRLHRPDRRSVRREKVAKGERMPLDKLAVIDWYVKGVES